MNKTYELLKKMSCGALSVEEIQKIYHCETSFLHDMEDMSIICKNNNKWSLTRLTKLIFNYILQTIVFSKEEIQDFLKDDGFSPSAIGWILDWLVDLKLLNFKDDEYILINQDENQEVKKEIKPTKEEKRSEIRKKIQESFVYGGKRREMTVRTIAVVTKLPEHIVRSTLESLRKDKFVRKTGYYKPYRYMATTPEEDDRRKFESKLRSEFESKNRDQMMEYLFNALKEGVSEKVICSIFKEHPMVIQSRRLELINQDRIVSEAEWWDESKLKYFTKEEAKQRHNVLNHEVLEQFSLCKTVKELSKKCNITEKDVVKTLNRLTELKKLEKIYTNGGTSWKTVPSSPS